VRRAAVLEAYALITHETHGHHDSELATFLHRGEQVATAQLQLRVLIRNLLTEAAATGELREDVSPDGLASYCLHALTAARSLPSRPRSADSSRSRWLDYDPKADWEGAPGLRGVDELVIDVPVGGIEHLGRRQRVAQ
jgi:hypothetical protein